MKTRFPFQFTCAAALIFPLLSVCQTARAEEPVAQASREVASREVAGRLFEAGRSEPNLPLPMGERRITPEPAPLSLDEVVRVALANNQDLDRRREDLRLLALSVGLTAHSLQDPLWRGSLSALIAAVTQERRGEAVTERRQTATQNIGVSQRLPTGGTVSADISGSYGQVENDDWAWSPQISARLTQPLLRGAGKGYAYESLTQGRRSLVYGLRGFKLQRDNLALDVMAEFLSLNDLADQITIVENNLQRYGRLARSTDVLRNLGMATDLDVFRAQQQEMQTRNTLLELKNQQANRTDTFKLALNLPPDFPLAFKPFTPGFEKITLEAEEATQAALENRLDLKTAAEVVQDRERGLGLARSDMLPDLTLNLSASLVGGNVREGLGFENQDYQASLVLNFPLERTSERLRLFGAWQSGIRSQRDLGLARDTITVAIRNSLRQIRRIESAMELNAALLENQSRGYRVARYGFTQGKVSNREVIEQSVALANAAIQRRALRTSHYMARLRLSRDMGRFDADAPLPAEGSDDLSSLAQLPPEAISSGP